MSAELLSSKITVVEEPPRIRNIPSVPTGITGMIGITERGPVGERTRTTSFEEWFNVYGNDIANGYATQAVRGFFQNGGRVLDFVRTVHYTDPDLPATKTSAQASFTVQTPSGSATPGAVLGTATEPFNLDPGDTLDIAVDGGAAATATFNATAADVTSGNTETFALSDSETLTVDIDGTGVQTVTFNSSEFTAIGSATAAEVAAVINAELVGASATEAAGAVVITSDTQGTDSSVEVTGGTANAALGFPTAVQSGTGNVGNIDAVTAAEAVSVINGAVSGATASDESGAVKVTSDTTGSSSSIQVEAGSTADDEFGFDNATHSGTDGTATDALTVKGKTDGAYANDIKPIVSDATSGLSNEFNLEISDGGVVLEVFPNVTMDPNATNSVFDVVNDEDTGSNLVTVEDPGVLSYPNNRPANGTHGPLTGGDDGLSGITDNDFIGSDAGKTGLRALDTSQDVSIIAIPDRQTSAVHNALVNYCENTRDGSCFAVLDPPSGKSATEIVTYAKTTASLKGLSEFGAMYWPQVKVLNPDKTVFGNSETITVPPSGHICGTYARTDARRPGGVYDQPAGVERGVLHGVVGFETEEVLEEAKRDLVEPENINTLTTFPGAPRHINNSRVLKTDSNFPSVAERRGVIFIEQSLKQGLQFARQAGNTPDLRATVERTTTAFLLIQMRNKAFRSQDPSKAFLVDAGEALNPPSAVFAKKLTVRIGLATKKPAEFIIIRVSQDTRALEEELAAAS